MVTAFVRVFSTVTRHCWVKQTQWTNGHLCSRHVSTPPLRRVRTGSNFVTMAATGASNATSVPLSNSVDVHVVPILDDNFSYLIHDKTSGNAALVDPATPKPLVALAAELGATITTSLTTHKHWDHAGGNEELAKLLPGLDIVGSAYEEAPAVSITLESGVSHTIRGTDLSVSTLHTPCHTNGHLCFTLNVADRQVVFTGDTLFVAGCGKFFEGNASDMHTALNSTLARLPNDTLVFCGHEYTVTNLKFAASVEPNNQQVAEKLEWAKQQVGRGKPTVPTSIADEKGTNPFMRNHLPELKAALNMSEADDVSVMKELRDRKNRFRP